MRSAGSKKVVFTKMALCRYVRLFVLGARTQTRFKYNMASAAEFQMDSLHKDGGQIQSSRIMKIMKKKKSSSSLHFIIVTDPLIIITESAAITNRWIWMIKLEKLCLSTQTKPNGKQKPLYHHSCLCMYVRKRQEIALFQWYELFS